MLRSRLKYDKYVFGVECARLQGLESQVEAAQPARARVCLGRYFVCT